MTDLDISTTTAERLKQLSEQEQVSVDELLTRLINRYGAITTERDDVEWGEAELANLLQPREALTGREIVEKHLASGVIGSWADMGIEDSVEWLNQQKARRQRKHP